MLHIIRDETYHGHIAASNVLLDGLFYATAPSYVEVAERGQYGKVLETDKLVDKLDQYPHVTARMRPDVSHDWYRDPAAYATALEDGLVAIDYWQDQRKIF